MDKVLKAVNKYYLREGMDIINAIPKNNILDLAYTEYEFGDENIKTIEVKYDLENEKYLHYIDGKLYDEITTHEPIEVFISDMEVCDFDSICSSAINLGWCYFGGAWSYDDFKDFLEANIHKYLSKEFKDSQIMVDDYVKNNIKKSGIVIRKQDVKIAPIIYLEDVYKEYSTNKMSIFDVCKEIEKQRLQCENIMKDQQDFMKKQEVLASFERAKEQIRPMLVGKERNKGMLENMPNKTFDGLACIYYIDLGQGIAKITNNMVNDFWGENIDVDTLHRYAIENQRKYNPPIHEKFLGEMDVIKTSNGEYGATALLDPEFMEQVKNDVGENILIIPSSINELILFNRDTASFKEVEGFVKEVNSTLDPQEILSDETYTYDFEKKEIMTMKHFFEKTVDKWVEDEFEKGNDVSFEMEF